MSTERKLLAEGKTKRIWDGGPGENYVLIESKDEITAGDGTRRETLEGKGILATKTTVNCFNLLHINGIRTHFLREESANTFRASRASMVPYEVVVRRIATGSYLKRYPEIEEKTVLPYVVEFFLKDDANHDPFIIHDFIGERILLFNPAKPMKEGFLGEQPFEAQNFHSHKLITMMMNVARQTFIVLERAWATQSVTLVDLKIEFGYANGYYCIADVIDNDSWRIWPGNDKSEMKDKQVFRDLVKPTPDEMAKIKTNYAWVAEQTSKFLW